ncbi:MAG: hypothetical protein R3F59_15360 [Myxococcota bacterium]
MLAGAVTVLVAATLPGAAYLLLVPALLVAPRSRGWLLVAGAVAILLWAPLMGLFYTALGGTGVAAAAVAGAVGCAWLGFALSDAPEGRLLAQGAAVVAAVAWLVALLAPRTTAEHPGQSAVHVIEGPDGWRAAATGGLDRTVRIEVPAEATARKPVAPPEVEVLDLTETGARIRVRSARGAPILGLHGVAGLGLSLDGQPLQPLGNELVLYNARPEGELFEITGLAEGLVAFDESYTELPDAARPPHTRAAHAGDRVRATTPVPW